MNCLTPDELFGRSASGSLALDPRLGKGQGLNRRPSVERWIIRPLEPIHSNACRVR